MFQLFTLPDFGVTVSVSLSSKTVVPRRSVFVPFKPPPDWMLLTRAA